jgi:hypothetical protein
MPPVARTLALDRPLYSKAELIEHRRNILRYARSFPPGSERNRHRQIALFAPCSRTRNGLARTRLKAPATVVDRRDFTRVISHSPPNPRS